MGVKVISTLFLREIGNIDYLHGYYSVMPIFHAMNHIFVGQNIRRPDNQTQNQDILSLNYY